MSARGRLLFVDAYDSFSNNVIGLLQQHLEVDVKAVHIDDEDAKRDLAAVLKDVDAIVIGPGPGSPANADDIGFIDQIWASPPERMLPVLGICLGFQSLALRFGADVTKLARPRHGIVTRISNTGTGMFEGVGDLRTTQYHSLRVEHESLPSSLTATAWDEEDDVNGRILMGLQHVHYPFHAVQFHPESICSSAGGPRMVKNWWAMARDWLRENRPRHTQRLLSGGCEEEARIFSSQSSRPGLEKDHQGDPPSEPIWELSREVQRVSGASISSLQWARVPSGALDATRLCEAMDWSQQELVVLDSQGHRTGRYSMVGVVEPQVTVQLTYSAWTRMLEFWSTPERKHKLQLDTIDHLWPMLQESLDLQKPRGAKRKVPTSRTVTTSHPSSEEAYPMDCPFWGGFMGYISYEAGLETINVGLHESCAASPMPDVNLTFMYRSVVFDHEESQVYVQSLLAGDTDWIVTTCEGISSSIQDPLSLSISELETSGSGTNSPADSVLGRMLPKKAPTSAAESSLDAALANATIEKPKRDLYQAKVLDCQQHLADGDSYELCLTDQTKVSVPRVWERSPSPWTVYKKLRKLNAAPFGAFVRLARTVVASSSPERFCRWSRSTHCEFRPMKGTVKKMPGMTREQAHEILNSSKERAENLMIVDLIRHDLGGIIGASNVSVSQLMEVEEYETVYQLVSAIEGSPSLTSEGNPQACGLDVLSASLPPGSMTGAPKKRSCEILREIEKRPRGVYSGVLGYLDVGGGGDFSVVIRTATMIDLQGACEQDGRDVWHLGAGGAVTIQSTAEGEFNEMETKATSALRAFLPV